MCEPPPVCGTVQEASTEAALVRMTEVAPSCSWIELRLDGADPGALDLARLVPARPRPLVVTCRAAREGGLWEGSEADRLGLLREAASLGAERIDVEYDAVDTLSRLGPLPEGVGIIVSRHAFESTRPEAFEPLLASVRAAAESLEPAALPVWAKLAVRVAGAEDALALLELARAEPRPTLAVAMGFPGVVTRLAGPRYGAPFGYAAADPKQPAAPGQLPASVTSALLAGRRISPRTRLLGIVGKPVEHSRSPELHNAAFAALGVDAVYSWLETDRPRALLERVSGDPGVWGFSVTMPHKQTLAQAPDVALEPEAAATGALNTLVRRGSGWGGHNTDALAARALLQGALGEGAPEATVAVLGCGGAARAVAWAARELGAEVVVYGRRLHAARALAEELNLAGAASLEAVEPGAQVVVNCTPVGMAPETERSPVPPSIWGQGVLAYDLVYTPVETRFLRDARANGASVVTGLEHFVAQARTQLELWLGPEAQGLPPGWLRDRLTR